jgi:murein DD-endopeptidase MepM/ murein hydrolase activator NlpD
MVWRANFDQARGFGVARKRRIADTAKTARAIPTGEGGATMTGFWLRTALVGASAMALQACDLPHSQYAPYEGYQTPTARPMAQPQYPVTADQPAPPAPMHSDDPHDPVAKPSGDVTSQPLPPPGPSSANPSMFIDASYDGSQPAFLTDVAYRHRRGHAMHVNSSGRLERSEAEHAVTVRKGDTIDSFARQYGTTKEAILKANHIRHPHDLKLGMTLQIPSDKAETADESDTQPSPEKHLTRREARAAAREAQAAEREGHGSSEARAERVSKPYQAGHGDTLYSLGRRFHVSPRELADLNGLSPNAHLHVGQTIKLPSQQEEQAQAEPAPSRRIAERTRERPHTRYEAALAPNDTAIGDTTAPSVAAGDTTPPVRATPPVRSTRMARNDLGPSASIGPAEPVPYDSLPGHLVGPAQGFVAPPTRPVTPPYVPPVSMPQAAPTPPDAQVVLAGRGRFVWPVRGALLSSFGPKPGGQRSDGLDISAPSGAPVHAAAAGDVVYAGDLVPGLGNLVLIKHEDGWITAYAHLSRTEVKIKDHVLQGAEIGLAGQTGGAAQPEVYFEIRYAPTPRDKAKPVDPTLLLTSQ